MSSEQQRQAREGREIVFEALKQAAYDRQPCPRYDQLGDMIGRGDKSGMNHVRVLHKEGRIIIHQMAYYRIVVEVDGRLSRASILRREAEINSSFYDDCDIVVDERKSFGAFLAKFNLRGLRFEDSPAACRPEVKWNRRPEPRHSSGVAQYG